jgi:hypothetical protein
MSPVNKKLAAGASLVALGGIAGFAVGQPGHAGTVKQAAAPVEVRTETVKRTVHVTRHEKPKHKRVRRPAAPAVAPRPASAAPPAPAPPVTSAPVYRAPAPAPAPRPVASVRPPVSAPTHHPVTTRTSGGGSAGGSHGERDDRHESEGGDD